MRTRHLEVVLFDVGGILVPDPWETLLLTPGSGIAARLGIDPRHAEAAGNALWDHYAENPSSEDGYWAELSNLLGTHVSAGLVDEVERELLRPNPRARELLGAFRELGARVGIVSNNTTFWWPKAAALTGIGELLDPGLVLLSHEAGCQKSNGLFDVAAGIVTPETTLVVDDRHGNVTRAAERGFLTRHYRWEHLPAQQDRRSPERSADR